ncbi:MAG: class III signal peptide-containing protein [Candidatus Altiarchaeales archaeon]|nr:class III signal peptide-containing protein [Candidatus Altiarchaeales archaeon]MBD3416579.1 class III signal peptide-containing protein [Candidatus Altiarchaeales archaeon]
MKPTKGIRNVKGQTSVEYLVLLAIAIVIVVVAVGVLAGFIKIGTGTTYKKKGNIYWKSADFGIADWEIYPEGANSTLILQNNKEYQVRLDWVSLDGGTTQINIDNVLLPGETYRLETQAINCSGSSAYSFELTFQYDNLEHGVYDKTFSGIEKLTGSCHS